MHPLWWTVSICQEQYGGSAVTSGIRVQVSYFAAFEASANAEFIWEREHGYFDQACEEAVRSMKEQQKSMQKQQENTA